MPLLKHTLTGAYLPDVATQFVVVYLPRTGSNLLATLLDSHPAILCHHELFNPSGIHRSLRYKGTPLSFGTVEERDRDPWAFLSRVYRFTDGADAVGFKLGPGGMYNWPLLSLLLSRRVRKIVLERRSWLHAYTSILIARETQVWSQPAAAAAAPPPDQRKVRVDPAAFRRFVRKRRVFYALTAGLLRATRQPWFRIAYEDLGNPEATARLLDFLSVDSAVALTAGTRRQNSVRLEDRIANYDEVRVALSTSLLAASLNSVDT